MVMGCVRFRLISGVALAPFLMLGNALAADPGSGAAAASAPAAPAQEAAAAGQNEGLQEVVVTANKRKQDIKDVPISISAIDSKTLTENHVVDYDDITRTVPGISFGAGGNGNGAGEGQSNLEIRGISSNAGSATVSLYLDEVPITVRNTFDGSTQPILFDLSSVEVLRGPQGTLYGASAMGGTVRFLTKQPNLSDFTADLTTDLSGTKHGSVNYDEQAVLNFPLIQDKLGLRIGLDYGDDSGWIDNYNLNGGLNKSGVNDTRHEVVKVTAKYVGEDDLTVTPQIFFQRAHESDTPIFYPSGSEANASNNYTPAQITNLWENGQVPEIEGLWKDSKKIDEYTRDTVFIPSVTVNKGLDFADLTTVSSYFWRQSSRVTDGSYYNSFEFSQILAGAASAAPDAFSQQFANPTKDSVLSQLPSPVDYRTTYGQISQEVRLSSKAGDDLPAGLRWVVGLYYSDQWDQHHDIEPIPGLGSTFQSLYGVPITATNSAFGFTTPQTADEFSNDVIYYARSRTDERQYAVFGQADFNILPNLHGAVGLRYLYSRVAFTRYGGAFYDVGNLSPDIQVDRYYAPTPKFSLTYDLNDKSSLYATAAKGFRLGGPTGPTPAIGTPDHPNVCDTDYKNLGITSVPSKFNSDSLWSYEFGTKSTVLDNTLSVNADVYYINWMQIQQTINLPICGFSFTSNVGNAESYGAELEAHYRPPTIRGLSLGVTGSVNHAVITASSNPGTAAVGEKVLYTPDWSATFSASYSIEIDEDTTAFIRGDYEWTGRSHGSFQRDNSNFSDPQYDVLNGSVGLNYQNYEVSLYAKNLSSDTTVIQRPQVNSLITGYTVRPLTVGLNATAHF